MSEFATPYELMGVKPGDTITFTDVTELPAFENIVAEAVDPTMRQIERDAWLARTALRDELQVPKFYGRIMNICLTVMDDPYQQLIHSNERNYKLQAKTGCLIRKSEVNLPTINRYTGFRFSAVAKSTGKPPIGTITSELWYFPVSLRTNKASQIYTNSAGIGGRSVHRLVAIPHLERNRFIEQDEASRHIGLEVLRNRLRWARPNTIRN